MIMVFLLKGISKECTGNGYSKALLVMRLSKEYVIRQGQSEEMDG